MYEGVGEISKRKDIDAELSSGKGDFLSSVKRNRYIDGKLTSGLS